MAFTTIKIRRDTAANWTTHNPTLALGEPGVETDTHKIKYGDGITAWSSLPYATCPVDGNSVSLQTKRNTAANWSTDNPTLGAGEFGYESDTSLFKIGDGATAWSSLQYANEINTKISLSSNKDVLFGTDTDLIFNMVTRPSTGPTAAINSTSGNLNGTYYYAITYVTASGETDSSAASASVAPSNQQVNLTNIPVPTDPRVTSKKLYRTVANSSDPVLGKYVATLPTSATTYTDNLIDSSLGALVPWVNTTGGILWNGTVPFAYSGVDTTCFGYLAMPNFTGYANSAFGSCALGANTTGLRNTAVGTYALASNTTGVNNTAVGVHALNSSITGSYNSAFGYGSLMQSLGNSNSAFGYQCLNKCNSGIENTALGAYSAFAITTGGGNCAIGKSALGGATTGENNTALGFNALCIGNGTANVALGFQAGYYETGSNKLFIDNANRGNEVDARTKSLIYGVFASSPANQILTFNSNVGVNTAPAASAVLDVVSTSKGFLPPRMTTTQRDAISSPAEGLMIYNSTTKKINFYNGTAWEAITSAV